MSRQRVLEHLEALVGFDTQNPPRQIDGGADIFAHCNEAVGSGFEVRLWDHGDGHVSWLAVRGKPGVLFNVHLDTVPNGEGWRRDPRRLWIEDGRAYGRGACDIKGAAACLLTIAEQAPDHMAILFTTDEEGAGGCCVRRFLEAGEGERFAQVIVAEPTGCRAVLGHRGYLSVRGRFEGVPGHSSEARAMQDSAIHQLVRWAAAALALAERRRTGVDDPGPCLNIGLARGGTKSNVIAGDAFVHWSARLAPGDPNDEFLAAVQACAGDDARVTWEVPFTGSPLPAPGREDTDAGAFARRHGMADGGVVDFWTEASIFSEFGLPALVLGPGAIAQAHAADEWVALDQLDRAFETYLRVVTRDE